MLTSPDDLRNILRLDSVESTPSGLSIWQYWASLAVDEALEQRLKTMSPWVLQSSAFSIDVLQALPSVAILERAMAKPYLDQGLLVAPFDMWVPAPYGYYIVASNRRVLQPL